MSKAEKDAAKKAEKDAAPAEDKGELDIGDGITVGDPIDIQPKNLPLVVKVPESASSAQKEYAKVLNGYAYSNPKKFAKKKAQLIKRLQSLAGHEVNLSEDQKLSINKSRVSFAFIKNGNEEVYAGQHEVGITE